MRIPKQVSLTKSLALTISLVLLVSGIVYVLAAAPSSTFWLTPGVYPGAPSFTVWPEGNNYFAKNANGEINSNSGTNATALLNPLINLGNVHIKGVSMESTIITAGTLIHPFLTFNANVENVTLSDMTIDGNNQTEDIIQIINNEVYSLRFVNIHFRNFASRAIGSTSGADGFPHTFDVTIQNCIFSGIHSNVTTSVIDLRSSRTKIQNNKLVGDGSHGRYAITVRYTNETIISGNYIEGLGAGILLWDYGAGANRYTYRNIISNNIVRDTFSTTDGDWGIVLQGFGVVADNALFNLARDGIIVSLYEDEYGATVSGNTVYNVASPYVAIWVHGINTTHFSPNVAVVGNSVVQCGYGIIINYANKTTVTGNMVSGATHDGIQLATGDHVVVSGNVVMECNTDDEASRGGITVYTDYTVLDGNLVKNNGQHDIRVMNTADYTMVTSCSTRDTTSPIGIDDDGTNSQIHLCWNSTTWIS